LEKLGINLGQLLVQIFSFGIVMVVLSAWVYKPLMNALSKRREAIDKGLEDARIAAEARENAEKDAAAILSEANTTAAKIVREAKEKAETAGKEVKADLELEIAKKRQESLVGIEAERERALSEIRTHVASLAIAAAQKLVGEALDEKRQHQLVDEFFSGIKNGSVVVLDGSELKGTSAEVLSALPLTESEQKVIKGEVFGKLGKESEIVFNVNPKILGGLIVKVGDKVVDGSVAGQIQNLRNSLD
jgi:F-type H+-transporting ATPase subunit b